MANTSPSIVEMLEAGVHFGHQSSRWHPKMAQYLFGIKNGVHVINLEKTVEELEKAVAYVRNLSAEGKTILFVGTKRQSRESVKKAAEMAGAPYLVERWVGGLITNFSEFTKRLKKFKSMQAEVDSGEIERYTKKEQATFKKQLEKMSRYLGGLKNLDRVPDALYIADLRIEKTAVTEANKMHVPIVAVCDSNVNPEKATYVIPSNDDAVRSIEMMANVIAKAVADGKADYEKKRSSVKMTDIQEDTRAAAPRRTPSRAVTKEQSV